MGFDSCTLKIPTWWFHIYGSCFFSMVQCSLFPPLHMWSLPHSHLLKLPFPRSVFGQQLKAAGKTKCSPQVRCCQCCFPACSGHAMNGTNNMWCTGAAQWPISLVQRPCLCSPVHHVNNVRQTAKVPTQGWILVQSKRKLLSGSHLSLWPHLCHLCIHAVLNLTQVREDHGAGPWQEPHALSGLARVLQHCPSQCSCHSSVCSGCNVGLACSQGSVPAGADPRCTPC